MRIGWGLWALALTAAAGEINDNWKLALDPSNIGKTNGWAEAVRADACPVPVPGVIQQVYPHACGVAWYYRPIARPAVSANERVLLRFGAVDYWCEVFVDGVKIGQHEGAEDPFEFDVTDVLRKDSLIAVRVINPGESEIEGFFCKTVPHRNKFEKMEFKPGWCYNTGGLTLPVSLDVVPAVRVVDTFVKSDWRTGRVTVETTVRNDTGAACEKTIDFVVRIDDAPESVCTHRVTRTCPAGASTFETSFTVPGFKLWDLDTPNVYTLTAGEWTTRFGFRDFRLERGWFTLNGRRIFLKSAHTGNHLPGGLAVVDGATPELEFRDFQNMKAMGYNCIRFIATQATPRQLDYCDRLGLMVYQETYASWCLADSPEAKRRYLDSIRAELKRDRNHPSLTIWGAINEMRQGDANAAARDMLPEMRKLDPTRLWIYSSGRWDLWPKKPAGAKSGWSYQFEGQSGPDWQVGSASNPGSIVWEHVWGEDGVVSNNAVKTWSNLSPVCGDLHFYPGYPHDPEAVRKIRNWSAGGRPAFLSEYGVGSLLDVIDHCFEFERRGISPTAPDYERMAGIRDQYLADWKKLGLSRFFADPVDFLRASDRMNARSRREGFDLVRSNPRFAGYNLTGALDHAICGEGPMSLFRRIKDDNFDVFRDGWNDLRWCLFLSRGNYFEGEDISFEAVLADFEALKDGDYQASFAVVDVNGEVKWRSAGVPFVVPQKDCEGLRAVAYPITKQTAKTALRPGAYRLRAYLDHGGYAAAYEKPFYVTARPQTLVASREFLELGFVGEAEGQAALEKVAAGTTALVHLEKWGAKPPKFLPLKNLRCTPRSHWLYHDDTLMVPNPLLDGLKTGFLDWDFYTDCFPRFGFTTDTEPESFASVNFNVGGPLVYNRSFNLATFRHGKGCVIVSTLPLVPTSPAGATILSNCRRVQ